jgi:HD-like signal output (HDOD) protein
VNLLRTDPVLTIGILRVANSPLFASRVEITDVRQAVTYLGMDLVRSLAVTTAMRGLIGGRPNPLALSFWRHSLAAALTCKHLSREAHIPPEYAYTAGLLHDVGQLGLMRLFPAYSQTVGGAVESGESLIGAEARLLGIDHCQAGQWMLSVWKLPLGLQNVAAGHESAPSEAAPDRDLIALVHAGSVAADYMGFAVIPPARNIQIEEIAAAFPIGTRQRLLETLPEMLESVRAMSMASK